MFVLIWIVYTICIEIWIFKISLLFLLIYIWKLPLNYNTICIFHPYIYNTIINASAVYSQSL